MTRPVEWGQVLAFRLQWQHLARAFPADTLKQAAHDGIGLHAQAMPATELAFRARTRGLRAGDLERALGREFLSDWISIPWWFAR